jgi:hypothetical protein
MAANPRALKDLSNLRVHMTTVTTNVGPDRRYVMLRITDDTSGQMIAEVNIRPKDLIDFMGNSDTKAEGRVGTATHRWGKVHEHEQRKITMPDGSRIGYGEQREHPAVLAAIEQAHADGWETTDYRFSHGNHSLVCRRWVDPE